MDFNSDQFRQSAFRGYGDQGMRHYRVTPSASGTATPGAAPAQPSGWSQPQLPDPSTVPSGPARLTPDAQARADIAAARGQVRTARVATARANAQSAAHRQTVAEARATQAQQRAAQATHTPPRVDPSSVSDNTPAPLPGTPSGPGRSVQINNMAFRTTSLRFGPPPEPPEPAPSTIPPRPTTPPRPAAPPAAQGRGSQVSVSPGMARAGRAAGVGAFVAAKALQSMSRTASDPKRSGSPLYKTTQGWMR